MVTAEYHKLPTCSVCNEAVEIETSKTDEDGRAVHEECAILQAARRYRDLADHTKAKK
jgi:hypothetical protein